MMRFAMNSNFSNHRDGPIGGADEDEAEDAGRPMTPL